MTKYEKSCSAAIGTRRTIGLLTFALMLSMQPIHRATADEDCGTIADERLADECRDSVYKRADGLLNRAYKAKMRSLNDDAVKKRALIASQRKWLADRTRDCNQEATDLDVIGATYNQVVADCETKKAFRRAEFLSSATSKSY